MIEGSKLTKPQTWKQYVFATVGCKGALSNRIMLEIVAKGYEDMSKGVLMNSQQEALSVPMRHAMYSSIRRQKERAY